MCCVCGDLSSVTVHHGHVGHLFLDCSIDVDLVVKLDPVDSMVRLRETGPNERERDLTKEKSLQKVLTIYSCILNSQ